MSANTESSARSELVAVPSDAALEFAVVHKQFRQGNSNVKNAELTYLDGGHLALILKIRTAGTPATAAPDPALMERMTGGFPPGATAVFSVDAAGRRAHQAYLTPRDLEVSE